MHIPLGTFNFVSAKESPSLVAEPVLEALSTVPGGETVGVCEIDPAFSDTVNFCEHYHITPDQAANCVIVEAKRGEERQLVACVVLASTRADVNGKVCEVLGMKKASFAPMERAVAESGMEFGAITPIGLPARWPIIVDRAVAESAYVIVGSGIRSTKLAVTGAFLATLRGAQVVDGLGQVRT